MAESSPDDNGPKRKDFFCGVVEGFYGRPWTTEQRKDLFQKLKKWGMDMYVYAPKDDYKHRAYWRELYTVEEAEHLTSLITAAKLQGITFCYALSPGLDITYSSEKEIKTLKRKLEQVSQFGCTCFALLFDDIEPEMSEADKQTFQSFAHAQVSVTNEMHQHLGCPKFLLCPTQYCSTRAVPTVNNSEYLNTLGSKLSQEIDVMWTGPKVISKILTSECIEEITQVLRRPPVIWDNLHANDYDQKRVFLGPYCGRSPELIPLLRGVLTNPNCEYNANMIPIWTLAHWANCSLDAPAGLEAVSWDIKLERESEQGVCEDEAPITLSKHVYHHRQALRHAINEWLPEFLIPKVTQGPSVKPQPTINVAPIPILPILPSINTCMCLMTSTSTTQTTSTAEMPSAIPTVNTTQILSTGVSQVESFNPTSNPVMNSLVSPTKVVLNESIPNPIIPMASSNISLPTEIPVSTLPVPLLGLKSLDQKTDKNGDSAENENVTVINESVINDSLISESVLEPSFVDEKVNEENETIVVDDEPKEHRNGQMSVGESPSTLSPSSLPIAPEVAMEALDIEPGSSSVPSIATLAPEEDVAMADQCSENGSMQVEPSSSPLSTDMMIEPVDSQVDETVEEPITDPNALTAEDLILLCDLFYLPFEHGSRALRLLHDYNWLASHAASTLPRGKDMAKPEVCEWRRRRCRFAWWCGRTRRMLRRLSAAPNKELHSELQPYVWELCSVLALLDAYVQWLELGKFPANIATNSQGTYTWFSKGWREAFESGAQEPWVFRGGLTADLRRLLPVECVGEVVRCVPLTLPLRVRPYAVSDEVIVSEICRKTCRDGSDCSDLFPNDLQALPADRLLAPFLNLYPEFCMLIEDDVECAEEELNPGRVVGYACSVPDSREFYKRQELAWIPEMRENYQKHLLDRTDLSQASQECIRHFHSYDIETVGPPESVWSRYPALITFSLLADASDRDPHAPTRLLTTQVAALQANGAIGVHVCINSTDHFLHQFYTKLGFTEVTQDGSTNKTYLGKSF